MRQLTIQHDGQLNLMEFIPEVVRIVFDGCVKPELVKHVIRLTAVPRVCHTSLCNFYEQKCLTALRNTVVLQLCVAFEQHEISFYNFMQLLNNVLMHECNVTSSEKLRNNYVKRPI